MTETADLIRNARKQRGLSQRALAERAGVEQSTIARIELGDADPAYSTVIRLLDAAGFRRPEPEPSIADHLGRYGGISGRTSRTERPGMGPSHPAPRQPVASCWHTTDDPSDNRRNTSCGGSVQRVAASLCAATEKIVTGAGRPLGWNEIEAYLADVGVELRGAVAAVAERHELEQIGSTTGPDRGDRSPSTPQRARRSSIQAASEFWRHLPTSSFS